MSPRPPPSWAQVDGFTYERSAIAKWFEDHDTDPETGAKLESKMLIPNRRLKSLIREFQEAQAAAAAAQEAQIAPSSTPTAAALPLSEQPQRGGPAGGRSGRGRGGRGGRGLVHEKTN